MNIEIRLIRRKDKDELKKTLLDYFKEIDKSKVLERSGTEEIDYPYLDSYWIDWNRKPLNILLGSEKIGFVLINNWIVNKAFNADMSIAEFYINPKFRRRGIGKKVAYELFNNYKGKWEIRQSSTNVLATQFWRDIIAEYTNGDFKEIINEDGNNVEFVQLFESC